MLFVTVCGFAAGRKAVIPASTGISATDGSAFLLPPPPTADRAALRDLLAAPLLDRGLILETAERLEVQARKTLVQQRLATLANLCGRAEGERKPALGSHRSALAEALRYTKAAARRYDHSVRYLLHKEIPAASLRAPALAAFRLAAQLAEERRVLIHGSWEDLFRQFESGPARLCADPARRATLAAGLPSERLFGPYYLALYRFYGALSTPLRMQLITGLHGTKEAAPPKTGR